MTVKKKSQLEVMLEAVAQEPRRPYSVNNFKFLRALILTNVAMLVVAAIDRGSLAVDISETYCPLVNLGFLAVSFARGPSLRKRCSNFKLSHHVLMSLLPLACLLVVDLAISQLPGHASAVDPIDRPAAEPARRGR